MSDLPNTKKRQSADDTEKGRATGGGNVAQLEKPLFSAVRLTLIDLGLCPDSLRLQRPLQHTPPQRSAAILSARNLGLILTAKKYYE